MSEKQNKKPLTKTFLNLLSSIGEKTIDVFAMFYDLRRYQSAYLQGGRDLVHEVKKFRNERTLKLIINRLQRSKYIKAKKIGKRLIICLTSKGYAVSLSIRLKNAPKRSDGLYTVVIFDIPESQQNSRRQFRLLLRQGGFIKLQQSVWISERDAYNLVADFIKEIKLQPWVNIFYSKNFLHFPFK
ncbi:MAG: CRISPR-associated endonuclease Cas2 [Patescibacteria group bacterium]